MANIKLGYAPTRRSIFSAPDALKYRGLTADRLRELGVDFVDIKSEGQVNAGTELESGEEGYGYCTEFIVRLEPSLIDKFSETN